MKLKPITYEIKKIPYSQRKDQKQINYPPKKVTWAPRWNREAVAYNFINKEFRAKRHLPLPLDKKIYNKRFTGNGAHGRYHHDKEDLSKVTGYNKLKSMKIRKNINFNEVAIQEKRDLNFNGAELKGRRTTLKTNARDYINNNKKKYNRGGQGGGRRSGAYSGGLMMREYERQQIKTKSGDKLVDESDEFSNLQDLMEEQAVPNNKLKVSSTGI